MLRVTDVLTRILIYAAGTQELMILKMEGVGMTFSREQ